MKEKRTASKISRWVLVILFLLGIAGIALYPFRNRNLQLKITTAEGSYIEKVGSDAIANGTCNHIEITGKEETEIIRVRIYGTMKSVLLKEMNYGEFASYIESVDNGTVSVVPGCTKITGDRNVKMNMNTDYVEMLQKMSSTFLQERLILMELWAVIVAFAAIATSAVIEKRTENNWDNHGPIFEVKKFFSDIKKYGQYGVCCKNRFEGRSCQLLSESFMVVVGAFFQHARVCHCIWQSYGKFYRKLPDLCFFGIVNVEFLCKNGKS